ncbi:MAG: DUF1553 domain-containing protein, partial [Gemmataceae bacterium]|nr:DUF1553 domain-containing protein [Gemmataceae bacterium]
LEKPLGTAKRLVVRMLFERYHAAGLGRFRLSGTAQEAAARDLPLDADAALLAGDEKRLRAIHLQAASETAKARGEIDALRKRLPAFPTTLVFQERPAHHPRPTHRHHRGEFLQPKEAVAPGVPSMLGTKDAPKDRLAFARWLFADDNPLTSRVVANRQWAALFGTGIVKTVEDFGTQGELPSHPELLDWLAVEFRESGWDMKRLHRLLVSTDAYRRSSASDAARRGKDSENRLLWRGPRQRLEAEQVRDSVLSVAGLLHHKLGGPSVFPPQPAGVTTEGAYGSLAWTVSPGLDRWRRGLYTFAKRTTPYAMGATFDGPSGEVCVARRESTNTALQALAMLNDAVVLEAAQELGKTVGEGDDTEKARRLFRRVLGRYPMDAETAKLVAFVAAQRARKADAWMALARVLLNLDEFMVKG